MKTKQTLLKSFQHAFSGMKYFFLQDRNGKIHLAAAVLVIAFSFALKISSGEWVVVLLCTAIVMSLEMINASIEKFCDLVQPDFHHVIKIIKDICAGAVLLAAIVSAAIACIIFIPKMIQLL
ncbi:MAG TPA: diacylglycerol kinase family protein [Panacibacter sp.]|nr:diacylglycerol kinase family protein [Panacibacter sp.]